ncbi:MAG: hypothetical protein BWY09_01448 [Candidatus Hydrogenedentes bacterium ADurb.Bin179]|jgi:hypothetical protein|nr:MAG: hypothetical protein BWY09_01448 [Candidatus Hydrogenedentes bacterium ADurb.Bin179]
MSHVLSDFTAVRGSETVSKVGFVSKFGSGLYVVVHIIFGLPDLVGKAHQKKGPKGHKGLKGRTNQESVLLSLFCGPIQTWHQKSAKPDSE